jgi:hypothetical protein
MTQTSNESEIDYRPAGRDHETDILAVFEEVASEIPVRLDGEESVLRDDVRAARLGLCL